jgi:hypothetical protein
MRITKNITILSFLFIFGIVSQVEADPSGNLNGNFCQEKSSNDNKFGVKSLLISLKATNKIKLIESLDRLFPLFKIDEGTRSYKIFNPWGVHEIKSLHAGLSPSISTPNLNSNRYVEDGGPQIIFELFQSKLKRTEIFVLFHFSFNPKADQMFLEMQVTPSSEKGINFFLPFEKDDSP